MPRRNRSGGIWQTPGSKGGKQRRKGKGKSRK